MYLPLETFTTLYQLNESAKKGYDVFGICLNDDGSICIRSAW